jgi:hypothetical protein
MAAPIEFGKPITDLPTHVTKLFERLPESGQANGFEAEFKVSNGHLPYYLTSIINLFEIIIKYLEKVSAEQDTKNNYEIANKIENRFKNRYNNVLPSES